VPNDVVKLRNGISGYVIHFFIKYLEKKEKINGLLPAATHSTNEVLEETNNDDNCKNGN